MFLCKDFSEEIDLEFDIVLCLLNAFIFFNSVLMYGRKMDFEDGRTKD